MHEGVCDDNRADGVDRQILTNLLGGVLGFVGDAAIVDEAVKAAIFSVDVLGGSLDGRIVSDINLDGLSGAFDAWESLDSLDGLLAILENAAANEDMIDVGGEDEVFGRFKANAFIGTWILLAVELCSGDCIRLEVVQCSAVKVRM